MVGATARPRLVVLRGETIGVRDETFRRFEVMNEAIPAVRVLDRIDDHDGVLHDVVDLLVVLCREQMVGGQHRGV